MAAEYLIPGGPYVVADDTLDALIPGYQFIVMEGAEESGVPKSTKFFLLGIG